MAELTFKRIGPPGSFVEPPPSEGGTVTDRPDYKLTFTRKTDPPSWLQSLLSGAGHGLGNVLYGGARIGARMGQAPEFGATEASITPERAQQVDELARQREETYQASPERTAHPIAAGIGSIGGETAGLLAEAGPLALAAPGGLAARFGFNAALGAGAALATPKGGESMEPKAQAGRAVLGALGGTVGTAIGESVGSILSRALAKGDDNSIITAFRSIMKPPRGQRSTEPQLQTQDRQILGSVDEIITRSRQTGKPLPTSLRDFTTALDENKRGLFQQYDSMAKAAGEDMAQKPNPHLVDAFRQTGAAAQQGQMAVADAQRALTLTSAAQQRAGDNVYLNSNAMAGQRVAAQRLQQVQSNAQRLAQRHQAVTEQMYRPYIDLAPVAGQLRSLSRESRFQDLAPGVAQGINALANRLDQRGFYGLSETQDVLQSLNSRLQAFYRNPSPSAASQAVADAQFAGALRQGLDHTIETLEGPGYQALKLRYGAMREVEKSVVAAYQREANKVPGGIGGIFADLWATEAGLKAAITLDPHALGTALAAKGAKAILQKLRDPNRAVARLFAQRASGPSAWAPLARAAPPRLGTGGAIFGADTAGRATRPERRDIRPSAIGQ